MNKERFSTEKHEKDNEIVTVGTSISNRKTFHAVFKKMLELLRFKG